MKNLKNLLYIHPRSAGTAGFIHPAPCTHFFFCNTWTLSDTQTEWICFMYTFGGGLSRTTGGRNHLTDMGGKNWQWTDWPGEKWRESESERRIEKLEERRERQVASGAIHLPSTRLDFPTLKSGDRFLSVPLWTPEEESLFVFLLFWINPRPPRSLCPLLAPLSCVKLSTVEFYYLSYAFLNT